MALSPVLDREIAQLDLQRPTIEILSPNEEIERHDYLLPLNRPTFLNVYEDEGPSGSG